ncbi:hypothetical protein GOEFS_016_00070 [Gordonia effusa NBRC 100432]|uniref:Cardiolipin synthase N-terminal domain-containing protein n=1 Tax=Gordonia effusa NBRC 100432 TaxID=1077974 RepID=H0QVN0_9ACTN|nr:PLDc N-terminal domain-containing protein [Gordonia effusa]GAB16881.1 hypothetical protein GOEFS_016_00070 [Gordonia effusa NBRC 100432]
MGTLNPIHLLILLIAAGWVALTVYALVGVVRASDKSLFDRLWWAIVIVVVPLVGACLWLAALKRNTRRSPA